MATNTRLARELLDVLIRAALVVALALFCFRVFAPFLDLMLWALILAVSLYPLHHALTGWLGGRRKTSAALIVIAGLLLLVVPVYLVGASVFESVDGLLAKAHDGSFHIPPPDARVAEWPLIGQPLHELWTLASTHLTEALKPLVPHLRNGSVHLVGKLAGLGGAVLLFIAAMLVAGVLLVYAEPGSRAAARICNRLFGPERGDAVALLCAKTIRTVAQGVVGIAFIQMLLLGAGFLVKGVPAAGVLAVIVLALGIMQVPLALVTLPVIGFVFYREGATAATIAFAVYTFVASLVDNVLKPILLGRGVDIPMPVILIGALGGMVSNGVIGLFIGPVAAAVAYKVFWEWVDAQPAAPTPAPAAADPTAAPTPETRTSA